MSGPKTTLAFAAFFFLAAAALGQDLPGKIRGYKTYHTNVTVGIRAPGSQQTLAAPDVIITLGKPELSGLQLTGAAFTVEAGIESRTHSGEIDFVMFRDFTVNGVPVRIDEFDKRFKLKRGKTVELERPLRVNLGVTALARSSIREFSASRSEWIVEGTALVFGRFERFGFTFKRVIPVKVAFSIANPLRTST